MAKLKVQLWADDVLVAETRDIYVWQKMLLVVRNTVETTCEHGRPATELCSECMDTMTDYVFPAAAEGGEHADET